MIDICQCCLTGSRSPPYLLVLVAFVGVTLLLIIEIGRLIPLDSRKLVHVAAPLSGSYHFQYLSLGSKRNGDKMGMKLQEAGSRKREGVMMSSS